MHRPTDTDWELARFNSSLTVLSNRSFMEARGKGPLALRVLVSESARVGPDIIMRYRRGLPVPCIPNVSRGNGPGPDGNQVGSIGGARVVILEAEAEATDNLEFTTRS
jgi:hypothetical protein